MVTAPVLVAPGGGSTVMVRPSSERPMMIPGPASNATPESGENWNGAGTVSTVGSLAFGPVLATVASGMPAPAGMTLTGMVSVTPPATTSNELPAGLTPVTT